MTDLMRWIFCKFSPQLKIIEIKDLTSMYTKMPGQPVLQPQGILV